MSKKKTSQIKKESFLTKTQKDNIKPFESLTSSLPEISSKSPKIRHSGHFVDQKLKYNYSPNENKQLELFDTLSPELKGEVEKFNVKYEGIKLSVSEDRLLTAIYTLLREKSENKDVNSEDFYSGNHKSTTLVQFGNEQVKPVHLRVTRSEIYKNYLGCDSYSGRDIKDINDTLKSLSQKRFLMKYDRRRKVYNGSKSENRTDRIELFQRLIDIVEYTTDLTDKEIEQIDQGDESVKQSKSELIIALNPILTDQINSKYVEYPQDINRRTILAAGGHPSDVTQSINSLRDYMLRELSSGRYTCAINANKLYHILKLDNYVKKGRKKLLIETTLKAIQTCKNLGLVEEANEVIGVEGQAKYVFKLNKEFK